MHQNDVFIIIAMLIKQLILVTILLLGNSLFVPTLAQSSITVTVKNIKKKRGKMYIALYDETGEWLADQTWLKRAIVTIDTNEIKYVFASLKPGKYAITLFHDENSNGKMDYNWLGIPTEKFGFSNNPIVIMSKPTYKEAEIVLTKEAQTVNVSLQGF